MQSLIGWNKKHIEDKTFANYKIFMRTEYLNLQEVGGLTVKNSILNQVNIIQELKIHQEEFANNLQSDFKANLMQNLHAYNVLEEHESQIPQVPVPQNETSKL